MSATGFNFSVIILPAPSRLGDGQNGESDFIPVNETISFALEINSPSDFRTLSTSNIRGGNQLKGLLYVPDLPQGDRCERTDLVPQNATRRANLPNTDLNLIAYAPYIDAECSTRYVQSAANDPVEAFIFYQIPRDNKTNGTGWSPSWPNDFPVYYINDPKIGTALMTKLSQYSEDMDQVYNGPNLTEAGADSRDFARIYTVISTRSTNPMPGLWLFLLVVVAVLLFIIGLTSLLMHLLQFHYRRSLRRRVANGEVDLEALGVGRVTVPREFLAKFPVYEYTADTPLPQDPRVPPVATTTETPAVNTNTETSAPSNTVQPITTNSESRQQQHQVARGYHQTSCPICLDDFVHKETMVRELPCFHIFHPECIDPYLESQSSLCVLCKRSCLPKGYVPIRLTNAVVRRERLLRRVRQRSRSHANNTSLRRSGSGAGRAGGRDIPLRDLRDEDGGFLFRWNLRRLRRMDEDTIGRQALSARASRGSQSHPRNEVVEDPVRPRWRRNMDRMFPGFH